MSFWVKPPESLGFFSPVNLIATWFGSGLLRPASGTWGSLAALPFAWAISLAGGHFILAVMTALIFAVGTWAADKFEAASKDKDPGSVVVDEVAGQWLTLLFVPNEFVWYVIAFAAFRFFDIIKLWPASWADQNVTGGLGIMTDDIFAGFQAGVLCLVLMQFI